MHDRCAQGVQSAFLWQDRVLWQDQHAQLCVACGVGFSKHLQGLSVRGLLGKANFWQHCLADCLHWARSCSRLGPAVVHSRVDGRDCSTQMPTQELNSIRRKGVETTVYFPFNVYSFNCSYFDSTKFELWSSNFFLFTEHTV